MLDSSAHILVVDDDARLGTLLRKYLSDNGYRVSVAKSAKEAKQNLSGIAFDLIVLDRMMPGQDGLSLATDIRNDGPPNNKIAILMLTAMAEATDRIDGLEVGIDDYLTKPFEPRELLLRIEAILRRARKEVISEIKFGSFTFDITRGDLLRNGAIVSLTSSEQILLKTLATSSGVTVSRETLSLTSDSQGRAVDVQITRLRRKIEEDPKLPRYLQTVRGEGYVLWAD